MCRCWLCCHNVWVVVDYADTCPHSCWLRWHRAPIVIDYANMMSAYLLTTLTWCKHSQWLHKHTFFANIIVETKNFAKPFLPVHMVPRWSFMIKSVQKSRDTVSLFRRYGHLKRPSFDSGSQRPLTQRPRPQRRRPPQQPLQQWPFHNEHFHNVRYCNDDHYCDQGVATGQWHPAQ